MPEEPGSACAARCPRSRTGKAPCRPRGGWSSCPDYRSPGPGEPGFHASDPRTEDDFAVEDVGFGRQDPEERAHHVVGSEPEALLRRRSETVEKLRVDRSRAEGRHPYPVAFQLLCERPGEADEAMFGGAVHGRLGD